MCQHLSAHVSTCHHVSDGSACVSTCQYRLFWKTNRASTWPEISTNLHQIIEAYTSAIRAKLFWHFLKYQRICDFFHNLTAGSAKVINISIWKRIFFVFLAPISIHHKDSVTSNNHIQLNNFLASGVSATSQISMADSQKRFSNIRVYHVLVKCITKTWQPFEWSMHYPVSPRFTKTLCFHYL